MDTQRSFIAIPLGGRPRHHFRLKDHDDSRPSVGSRSLQSVPRVTMASPSMKTIASSWTRPDTTADDPQIRSRIALRVCGAMAQALHRDPIRIAPERVGISPLNRLFSAMQVHKT